MQKEALYKQQLVELGMLRDEEKQTFKRQEETQVTMRCDAQVTMRCDVIESSSDKCFDRQDSNDVE